MRGITLTVLSFFILIAISSCKKKEIQGPKGDAGPNGTGGNATEASSDVFVIATTQWQVNGIVYEFDYSSALLTSTVVNQGAVQAFVESHGSWWQLPLAEGDQFTQVGFSDGKVTFQYSDLHGGLPVVQPVTRNYRVVVNYESQRPAGSNRTQTSLHTGDAGN